MNCADPAIFEGTRVLLAEDDYRQAADLAELMSALGCKVIGPAGRLEATLNLVARKRIDAAIVDLMLAGKSALPLLTLLAGKKIPAIVTTAFGRAAVPKELRYIPYHSKPINRVRLIASMEAMFPRPRQTPERRNLLRRILFTGSDIDERFERLAASTSAVPRQ